MKERRGGSDNSTATGATLREGGGYTPPEAAAEAAVRTNIHFHFTVPGKGEGTVDIEHTTTEQTFTGGGRQGSAMPNIQQQPRHGQRLETERSRRRQRERER